MAQDLTQLVRGGSFMFHPAGSLPQFIAEENSEDALAIAEAARDFVNGEVLPRDEAIDKLDLELTRELLAKVGDLGFLGMEIPEAYGGLDLDKKTALLVLEEMAKQASFSTSYTAHTSIGTMPIVYFGNPEQKAKYLPKLATGEWCAAYALTEAGSGSDALGAKATAVLQDGHWVLNGTKAWITNAGFADVFVIFAKINGSHLSAFIVEKTDPGISTGAEEKKMGIKGSSTRTVILENCRIPEDRLLGGKGKGARIALGILNVGRFKLGASSVGAGKRVLDYTLKYAGERTQFGKPLTAFGLIQQKLANMAMRIFVGESMSFRTIGYLDEALAQTSWESETGGADKMKAIDEYAVEASMSKVWGSEALFATADDAVQTFGGAGFSAEYPAEKIYRDCRINRIFEGTNEINRMLVAGTFLKRCGGTDGLPLAESVGGSQELPQDELLRTVALAKARALKVIARAQADHGPKILENQEASAHISNLLIEIYAMESAVVRAQKLAATSHRWASLARDLATVYAQEAWNRVQAEARMLAGELAEGEALDALMAELLAMQAPAPVPMSTLRQRIAQALVEQGGYPLSTGK
ncbi:acyl-CoA dehydrogenase family protein [Geothrix sp. PMB-07]|uniref:acyl-CoA dehydrogenase family protein n=1 Tax=Geothrix sp. PMB-07 TaxID=3068640 RepID=UPI002740EBE3|nr:acyl-CoA dehydrogenase family protein [Geothrix sp. PMB-07]WLT30739.1 acyl-CoA dehydrogenase family protein [Geothrix sp. PMB-07]